MTPLQLSILLHYYWSAEDFRSGDLSAPAVRAAIDTFRDDLGLLSKDGEHGRIYKITQRGQVFIYHLLQQPLPEQQWVMPCPT